MDVLVSGSERPPRPPLTDLLRRRPPSAAVVVVAVLQLLVGGAAVASLPAVEREQGRLSLRAEVLGSTVALRGRGTDGVLRLRVWTTGRREVVLGEVALRAGEVRERGTSPRDAVVRPGRDAVLAVRYAVPSCRRHDRTSGELRIPGRTDDGRTGELAVSAADLLASGCGGAAAPDATVVGAEVVRGRASAESGTASGTVTVAVRSAGATVRLVAVTADVPGVLFVSPTLREEPELPAGARRDVEIPFIVPFCPAVRPLGGVLVTVREPDGVLRQLRFAATADGEARVTRDVDLDVVLRACG